MPAQTDTANVSSRGTRHKRAGDDRSVAPVTDHQGHQRATTTTDEIGHQLASLFST
jgi:hypothetical protein